MGRSHSRCAFEPVLIGVAGEIHIGGDGLAQGYLNLLELTAEKFVTHAFDGISAKRLTPAFLAISRGICPTAISSFSAGSTIRSRFAVIASSWARSTTLAPVPTVPESVVSPEKRVPGTGGWLLISSQHRDPPLRRMNCGGFCNRSCLRTWCHRTMCFWDLRPLTPNGNLTVRPCPAG